jgi:hypothetical protein
MAATQPVLTRVRTMEILSLPNPPPFAALADDLEPVCRGRRGGIVVDDRDGVPVVRSTTPYQQPTARFRRVHHDLVDAICAALPGRPIARFNNLMVETYTGAYRRMGFHTDMALDLAPSSVIAIYSCYDRVDATQRQLVVRDKVTGATTRHAMPAGSVVLFDLDFNRRHVHKIVLPPGGRPTGVWLGVTLRCSNTLASELHMADEQERANLLRLRGEENRRVDFQWPALACTLSPGDLMPING